MKNWKLILATLVIFGAGVLSGTLGNQLYLQKKQAPKSGFGPGGPGPERFDFIRRWSDRLDLTTEQRDKIDRLVRESQERVRTLWDPVGPKIQEEMRAVRTQIEAVLTPEQRTKFAEMSKDRFRRGSPPSTDATGEQPQWHRRDGSGRPGEGQRPEGAPPGTRRSRGERPVGPPTAPPDEAPARPQ